MPLDPAQLADGIRTITDPTTPGHTWPAGAAEAAERWGGVVVGWLGGRVGPPELPGASVVALAAFRVAFERALIEGAGGGPALAGGAAAALGVLSLAVPPPSVATAPPAPLSLPPMPPSASPPQAAQTIAGAVAAWVSTALWSPNPAITPPGPWT